MFGIGKSLKGIHFRVPSSHSFKYTGCENTNPFGIPNEPKKFKVLFYSMIFSYFILPSDAIPNDIISSPMIFFLLYHNFKRSQIALHFGKSSDLPT